MLVLSRKEGERIVIGGSVVITIVHVGGDRVRVGVDAPGEVPVHREEVFRRLQRTEPVGLLAASPNDSAYHPEFA